MSEINERGLSHLITPGMVKSSMTEEEFKFRESFSKDVEYRQRPEAAAFVEGAKFILLVAKRYNLEFTFPDSLLLDVARTIYPDFDPLPPPVPKHDVGF